MRFSVITLFPELVESLVQSGVTGRAADRQLISLQLRNPRDFATDVHRTVDDRPYGGGPGMVMRPDCLLEAIAAEKQVLPDSKVIYLSPQGKPIQQKMLEQLAADGSVILLCGRYEGVDERVIDTAVDEEWSLGDYVLSGGELAAMVVIDGVSRLVPGVLGDNMSAAQDSFSDGLLDCPHYTRPEDYKGQRVPEVLLSGNHSNIASWRRKQALGRTWLRRPELLEKMELSEHDKILLTEFRNEQD